MTQQAKRRMLLAGQFVLVTMVMAGIFSLLALLILGASDEGDHHRQILIGGLALLVAAVAVWFQRASKSPSQP